MTELRTCNLCQRTLPLTEFYVRGSGHVYRRCKVCHQQGSHESRKNQAATRGVSDFGKEILRLCNKPEGATHAELCDATGRAVSGMVTSSLINRGVLEEILISPKVTGELQRGNRPRKKWRTTAKGRELIADVDTEIKEV